MFWAKTREDGFPGVSVRDHCINVGAVAEVIWSWLPKRVRELLPTGTATLAALHDIGKITLGFQVKCPHWLLPPDLPKVGDGEKAMSVSDHALVSQVFLQKQIPASAKLWAVAVGAHHGKPKGRTVKQPLEAVAQWAEENRRTVVDQLIEIFGPLPDTGVNPDFAPTHSDLWLLAGLITFADWIGSNEKWFPPDHGLPLEDARKQARHALHEIGWPGGQLRKTDFATAFASRPTDHFIPNPLQSAVADLAPEARILIVEGPMGCGKTEAALYAAQQLIGSGENAGLYFALPTQVTSNRIHRRVEQFLRNSLEASASFRLAHGNAWLEDSFDLQLRPAYPARDAADRSDVFDNLKQARSWFASAKQALLAPYGVGTVDQALQSVVAVKHFFVRRFALAGKVVILDEVHSYDIYTGTLITALIRELVNLRCSVIILSATLTAARRRELLAAGGFTEPEAPTAYPLLTSCDTQGNCLHISPEWHSKRQVQLRANVISEEETIEELIQRAESGQHVLWIRNTVIEAQDAYRTISGNIREGTVRLGLLHSRFPFQRRAELEEDWLERLGKNRAEDSGSILVATQESNRVSTLIWILWSRTWLPPICCSNVWAASGVTNDHHVKLRSLCFGYESLSFRPPTEWGTLLASWAEAHECTRLTFYCERQRSGVAARPSCFRLISGRFWRKLTQKEPPTNRHPARNCIRRLKRRRKKCVPRLSPALGFSQTTYLMIAMNS